MVTTALLYNQKRINEQDNICTIVNQYDSIILKILMYESSLMTEQEWVAAVPGQIPDQAVMFGNHSDYGAIFVARIDTVPHNVGSFASKGSCAEYYSGCTEQFSFLVLRHGESTKTMFIAILFSRFVLI